MKKLIEILKIRKEGIDIALFIFDFLNNKNKVKLKKILEFQNIIIIK